jgi:ABC-type Mn2+/Zn2+ transport system permease subunit
MEAALIAGWLAAAAFFVWEFVIADTWHRRVATVSPLKIRLIDAAFLLLISATLVYLFRQ